MKLSIITINFNNKDGLQKTIDSVISQTWKDFEWIIIDGGSTDGSKELIEQYQQYIAYWCSEPDKGVYNAMNKGIAKARGEYLNFMNSGDLFYEPTTLWNVFHEKLWGDVVYGDNIAIDNGKELIWQYPHHMELEYFYEKNICHQAMFIKCSILKKEGYDESYKIYGDWARWLMIAFDGGTFQYVPYFVCKYELGGISIISAGCDKIAEFKKMINSLPLSEYLRNILIANIEMKSRLYEYEECQLTKDTLSLIKDNSLFIKLIHLNLIFLKGLKRIFSVIRS